MSGCAHTIDIPTLCVSLHLYRNTSDYRKHNTFCRELHNLSNTDCRVYGFASRCYRPAVRRSNVLEARCLRVLSVSNETGTDCHTCTVSQPQSRSLKHPRGATRYTVLTSSDVDYLKLKTRYLKYPTSDSSQLTKNSSWICYVVWFTATLP
jgi:hypothetical protein